MRDTTCFDTFQKYNERELVGYLHGVRHIHDPEVIRDTLQNWYVQGLSYNTLARWDRTGGACYETYVYNSLDWVIDDSSKIDFLDSEELPDEHTDFEHEAWNRVAKFRQYLIDHGGNRVKELQAYLQLRIEGRNTGPHNWTAQLYKQLMHRFLEEEQL